MKKSLIIFIAIFTFLESFSQCRIDFVSKNGKPFYLILDGNRINNRATPVVSIDKITSGNHTVVVRVPGVMKSLQTQFFLPEDKVLYEYDVLFDGRNYYLSFYGAYSENFIADHPDLFEEGQNPAGVNPPVNDGDDKDININIFVNQVNTQSSVQNTGSGTNDVVLPPPPEPIVTGNCSQPVSEDIYDDFLVSLEKKNFDDTKVTVAKQFIKNNCLTSSQIYRLLKVIDFEDSRLDLAKYAYKYVFDPQNYYKVNDAFNFSDSIDELNKFINSY